MAPSNQFLIYQIKTGTVISLCMERALVLIFHEQIEVHFVPAIFDVP